VPILLEGARYARAERTLLAQSGRGRTRRADRLSRMQRCSNRNVQQFARLARNRGVSGGRTACPCVALGNEDSRGDGSRMKIFFSTLTYALTRTLGAVGAAREFSAQILAPNAQSLPVARAIARIRTLADVTVMHDLGSAHLGKARSRQYHSALESGAEIWVSCDDDGEATTDTFRALLSAVACDEPAICLVPMLMRPTVDLQNIEKQRVNIAWDGQLRRIDAGASYVRAKAGGFGLVAINRSALLRIAQANALLTYTDDDQIERNALFADQFTKTGGWLGEDLAFFSRVPSDVRVEALVTGVSYHAGLALDLHQAQLLPSL